MKLNQINSRKIAYCKIIATVIIWAGVYHVAKYLSGLADVASIALVRFLLASIVLFVFYRPGKTLQVTSVTRAHWIMLMLIGFFGIAAYNVLFFAAEKRISADNVAIIYAFAPCLTVLLSMIFLKQRLSSLGYLGIAIALVGTMGVLGVSNPECGQLFCRAELHTMSLGQVYAILAMLSFAMYCVLVKKAILMRLDSIVITKLGTLCGAVLLLINYLFFGGSVIAFLHHGWVFWLGMLYTSVIATAVSYKWYNDVISVLGVPETVVFQNGVPFFTILIGIVITGSGVSWLEFVCGVVIVTGVLVTNYAAY